MKTTLQNLAHEFARQKGFSDLTELLPKEGSTDLPPGSLRQILTPKTDEELYDIMKSLSFEQQVESFDLNMTDFRKLAALEKVLQEDPVLAAKWTALVIARIGELREMLKVTAKAGDKDTGKLIRQYKRITDGK